MKYNSAQEALKALVGPAHIATAFMFNGHGIVMRIATNGEQFVFALDDGGAAVRQITFRDRHELEAILPIQSDPLEVGFEDARDGLITKFIADCGRDAMICVSDATAACPLCGASWDTARDPWARVSIYDRDLDRTVRVACGTCLVRFPRGLPT